MKLTLHFLAACLATFLLASVAHSQMVLAELTNIDVVITLADRLQMTLSDLAGLLPSYGVVIAISLLLAFSIKWLISSKIKKLPDSLYVLAGFLAIACALAAMHPILDITLIAGARTPFGLVLQAMSGAVGGYVFMKLRQQQ